MRDRSVTANREAKGGLGSVEIPVILAYSANPALSPSTIASCVAAGASGALKPPYDFETSKIVRRMVRAAREGRISSVVGLGAAGTSPTMSQGEDVDTTVVLPPTALRMGGEREGEKVLSAAVRTHQRGMSGSWYDRGVAPSTRKRENSAPTRVESATSRHRPGLSRYNSAYGEAVSAETTTKPVTAQTKPQSPADERDQYRLFSLYQYDSSCQNRRRSVDTGGLGIALRRAQRTFEKAAAPRSPSKGLSYAKVDTGFSFPSTPTKPSLVDAAVEEEERRNTELAELLGAMYYQTIMAIQIQMAEYTE